MLALGLYRLRLGGFIVHLSLHPLTLWLGVLSVVPVRRYYHTRLRSAWHAEIHVLRLSTLV